MMFYAEALIKVERKHWIGGMGGNPSFLHYYALPTLMLISVVLTRCRDCTSTYSVVSAVTFFVINYIAWGDS